MVQLFGVYCRVQGRCRVSGLGIIGFRALGAQGLEFRA